MAANFMAGYVYSGVLTYKGNEEVDENGAPARSPMD